jgi:ATP-dependent RNA helicase DeaD
VGKEEELTVNTITHNYFFAKGKMKYAALLAYIKQYNPQKTIIFSRTKHDANVIHMILRKQGYNAMLMHGGLTQAKREKSLDSFRLGAQFMIATNVASRGLDIDNVTDIINFDAPEDPHVYVHRVGRSARMGRDGRAFTIVGYDEKGLIRAIEYDANVRMQQIELKVDDFMNLDVLNHLHERRFEGREDMNRRPHRDSRSRDGNRKGGGGDNRWKHKRREFGPRREFRPHT